MMVPKAKPLANGRASKVGAFNAGRGAPQDQSLTRHAITSLRTALELMF